MKANALLRLALIGWAAVAVSQANPAQPNAAKSTAADRGRQFASLPQWSGIWESEVEAQLSSGELEPALEDAEKNPDKLTFTLAPPGVLLPLEVEFFRHVQMLATPPYNSEWAQKYESLIGEVRATPAAAVNPADIRACTQGYPLLMESPTDGMFEALVTPELTLLLFADGEVRHIYTDGRAHPKKEDLWPTPLGDSIGHWEGATLVIDTIERTAGPILPIPHFVSPDLSEQAHFIERLRRVDRNTLQDELTIEDPARLAHPWKMTLRYRRVTNMDRMIPTNCTENERNPVVNGKVTIAPR
jgi:hypothetical protein